MQCEGTTQAACSGMPIWQICFSQACAASNTPRVAVRTPYWLCFFSLEKAQKQAGTVQHQDAEGEDNEIISCT